MTREDQDYLTGHIEERIAAHRMTREDPVSRDPVLDTFTEKAAKTMRERMAHGAAKFGAHSWRRQWYSDDRNMRRLQRAVAHLLAALEQSDDPEEWAKRAADVANQAFMYADPERRRFAPVDDGYDGRPAR